MANPGGGKSWGGITVAVDEHVDIKDMDMVLWAICSVSQPHLDSRIYQYTDVHPLQSNFMPETLSQGMRRNQFHPEAGMPGDWGVPGGSGFSSTLPKNGPIHLLTCPGKNLWMKR